jgi:hypothetical protein
MLKLLLCDYLISLLCVHHAEPFVPSRTIVHTLAGLSTCFQTASLPKMKASFAHDMGLSSTQRLANASMVRVPVSLSTLFRSRLTILVPSVQLLRHFGHCALRAAAHMCSARLIVLRPAAPLSSGRSRRRRLRY